MIEHAYQETYTVYPHDVDFTKYVKPTQILARILTSAGLDSESRNGGVDTLHQAGCTWVLSRIAIEFVKQPYLFEEVQSQTWVEANNKLINTRSFLITYPNGDTAIRATSFWSLIDMNTRKVINLENNPLVSHYPINPTSAGLEPPARVADVKEGTLFQHTIAYNDMDYNQHANSVRYLQWVLDTYPMQQFIDKKLQRIDINYQHEVGYGTTVEIIKQENENTHLLSIKNPEGQTLCKIKLVWTDKDE
jgi:acyl-ACP thioesterase